MNNLEQDKSMIGMTPSLLVAPPTLKQSFFEGAVILLCGHQKEGSMGFIINRPLGLLVRDLLDEDDEQDFLLTQKPIYFGGPVAKNSGFIIYEHEEDQPLSPGISVSKTISISPARKILEEAAQGRLPGRFELILGHAAWKKNQLFSELSKGGWLHLPFSESIFFDVAPEDRYLHCFTSLGSAPYAFMRVHGGAQA